MSMTMVAALAAGIMASPVAVLRAAETTNETLRSTMHGQFSRKDYKFAHEAAHGGMLEVKLGELAKQKTSNPTVQQFADEMVTDHNKVDDQQKQLATQKGATLPTQLNRK